MKKYLKMLGCILLFTCTYFLLSKLAAHLYFDMLGGLPNIGESLKENIPLYHLFQDAIQVPIYILLFILVKKKSLFKVCNFKPLNKSAVLVVIIIGLGTSFFTASFIKIPWVQTGMPQISNLLNDRLLDQHPLQFLFWVVLHAGLYREILFRGMLFNEFRTALPVAVAMTLQGLMYGFLFFGFNSPDLVFYSFLTCVIFGYVYAWCESLWAPVIMQIASFTGLYILKRVGDHILVGESVAYFVGLAMIIITTGMMYLREYEGKHISDKKNVVIKKEFKEDSESVGA